jgi:iron complex outermembrane receptor protein
VAQRGEENLSRSKAAAALANSHSTRGITIRTLIPAGLLLVSVASPAFSQTAADNAAGSLGPDIVVTAQKRTERLQDVPLAVSVLSAATLAAREINDTTNLVQAVPSLSFQQGNNPTNTTFRIRGIGTSLFSQGVESSVSVVVDGVVAARQAQNFTDFADIERVEVLRGPQGTLFGKNATAGVISVITARPSNQFEAQANATIAEEGEYRISGTASGPLTQNLKARLTGYYNDVGGYAENTKTSTNANGFESWGVRGKLEWNVASNLDLLLAADYRKSNADCCNGILVKANNPQRTVLAGPVLIAPDSNQVWNNDQTFADSTQKTISLQGDLDLGSATLTSITAYQDFNLRNNFEVDRIGYDTPVFISPTATAQQNYNYGETHVRQFSQELRVSSRGGGRLSYVGGVYYSNLDLDRSFARRRALCATGTFAQACTATSFQSLASQATNRSTSIAGFGQLEYELLTHFKLIGGVRLQHETNSVAGERLGVIVPGDGTFGGTASARAKQSASDTALTGKVGAQYEFSRRAQLYATYTRGYKGLGFDTEITADFAHQKPVLPEYVNAYEVGFKGQTSDGRLTVAAAAFLADYTNLQIQANRSDPTTNIVTYIQTNAGSSQTKGFELETTWRPFTGFSVNAAATYARARLNADGLNCPTQLQAGAPTYAVGAAHPTNLCYKYQYVTVSGTTAVSAATQDVRNGVLPASPAWRVNVSPRFEHALGQTLQGFLQIDYSFQSKQGFAVEQDPLLVQKAYSLVDLSIGVHRPDSRYTLTFFVKNLFNQNFYTSISSATLLPSNTTTLDIYANRPKNADRYVGGTLSVKI